MSCNGIDESEWTELGLNKFITTKCTSKVSIKIGRRVNFSGAFVLFYQCHIASFELLLNQYS